MNVLSFTYKKDEKKPSKKHVIAVEKYNPYAMHFSGVDLSDEDQYKNFRQDRVVGEITVVLDGNFFVSHLEVISRKELALSLDIPESVIDVLTPEQLMAVGRKEYECEFYYVDGETFLTAMAPQRYPFTVNNKDFELIINGDMVTFADDTGKGMTMADFAHAVTGDK